MTRYELMMSKVDSCQNAARKCRSVEMANIWRRHAESIVMKVYSMTLGELMQEVCVDHNN